MERNRNPDPNSNTIKVCVFSSCKIKYFISRPEVILDVNHEDLIDLETWSVKTLQGYRPTPTYYR